MATRAKPKAPRAQAAAAAAAAEDEGERERVTIDDLRGSVPEPLRLPGYTVPRTAPPATKEAPAPTAPAATEAAAEEQHEAAVEEEEAEEEVVAEAEAEAAVVAAESVPAVDPGKEGLRAAEPPAWLAEGETITTTAAAAAATAETEVEAAPSFPGVQAAIPPPGMQVPTAPTAPPELVEAAAPTAPPLEVAPATATATATAPALDQLVIEAEAEAAVAEPEPRVYDQPAPLSELQLEQLYSNPLLEDEEGFVRDFLRGGGRRDHPLFTLVERYRTARIDVAATTKAVQELRQQSRDLTDQIWVVRHNSQAVSGKCADNLTVSLTRSYETAHFDERVCERLKAKLENLRDTFNEGLAEHSFVSQVTRLEVDAYVNEVLKDTTTLAELGQANINLVPHAKRAHVDHHQEAGTIRECIDVLFSFCRMKQTDATFTYEVNGWLERFSSVLLRIGTFRDHRFLLSHVLRCRQGSGSGSAKIVQFPPGNAWNDDILDHVMAMLHTLLGPVEPFREGDGPERVIPPALQQQASVSADWEVLEEDLTTVPRDTVESQLAEDDYLAILEQFPFSDLLAYALRTRGPGWRGTTPHTGDSMLQVFAFTSAFVRVLAGVLRDRSKSKFRHFLLHLAQNVSKCLCALSIYWSAFKDGFDEPRSTVSLTRLQVEFDQVFLRAFSSMRIAKQLGVWQFISNLPYGNISLPMAWRIFIQLYTNGTVLCGNCPEREWRNLLKDDAVRLRFGDVVANASPSDAIAMITTLANLATSREATADGADDEIHFVRFVASELLYLSCICLSTREQYLKTGRDLAATVVEKHPFAVSQLLSDVRQHFATIGQVSVYFFHELPLRDWAPSKTDLQNLRDFLLADLEGDEQTLARSVLSRINWGMRPNSNGEGNVGDLLVSVADQRNLAVLLVEANAKHAPPSAGDSRLLHVLPTSQFTRQQEFTQWCWGIMLRLHLTDAPRESLHDAAYLWPVRQASDHPLGAFVALMVSRQGSLGHAMEEAIPLLKTLVDDRSFEAALRTLYHAVPDAVQTNRFALLADARFTGIVQELVNADHTLESTALKLASKIVKVEFKHKFTDMFADLLTRHCNNSVTVLAEFWLRGLVFTPAWHLDGSARQLVEAICGAMFRVPGGRNVVNTVLKESLQQLRSEWRERQGTKGLVSGLLSWVTGVVEPPPGFTDFDAAALGAVVRAPNRGKAGSTGDSARCPHLVFESLVLEARVQEADFRRVGEELVAHPGRKVADTLRKLKMQPAETFLVVKWAKFCCLLDFECPLLPLFWEEFFRLFFAHVTLQVAGAELRRCFGQLFFHGVHKTLLALARNRLNQAFQFYQRRAGEEPADRLAPRLSAFYFALSLWLSDPGLQALDIVLPTASPENQAERLRQVVAPTAAAGGDPFRVAWLDLVPERAAAPLATRVDWSNWSARAATASPRAGATVAGAREGEGGGEGEGGSVNARIEGVLAGLDPPGRAVPPSLRSFDGAAVCDAAAFGSSRALFEVLGPDWALLQNAAELFITRQAEIIAFDHDFLDDLPHLYVNEPLRIIQDVSCKSDQCKGPAHFDFEVSQQRVVGLTRTKITENRRSTEQLLATRALADGVCRAAIHLKRVVAALLKAVARAPGPTPPREVAQALFYELVARINARTDQFPPTRLLYAELVQGVGASCISPSPDQAEPVLALLVDAPEHSALLAPLFDPNACPARFVELYTRAVQQLSTDNEAHHLSVLRRYRVADWLADARPLLSDRSRLCKSVVQAITQCTAADASVRPRLHPLFDLHRATFSALVHFDFPDQFGDALSALLEHSSRLAVPAVCWTDLVTTLVAQQNRGAGLSKQQALQALQWMTQHFMTSRKERGPLYGTWTAYLQPVFHLSRVCLQPFSSQAVDLAFAFDIVQRFYEPWLFVVDEASPFAHTAEDVSAAEVVAQSLCSQLLELEHPASAVLDHLWLLYTSRMAARAEEHVAATYQAAISGLQWYQLKLRPRHLEDMLHLMQERPSLCAGFFGKLLPMFDWESAEAGPAATGGGSAPTAPGQGGADAAAAGDPLHATLLRLLLLVVQHRTALDAPNFGQFMSRASSFSWFQLPGPAYATATAWAAQHVDGKGFFTPLSPGAYTLRLLRVAGGLHAKDVGMLGGDSGVASAGADASVRRLHPDLLAKASSYLATVTDILFRSGAGVTPDHWRQAMMWLLRDVEWATAQYGLTEAVQTQLLQACFNACNFHETGSAALRAIVAGAQEVLEARPRLALPAMSGVCRSLACIDEMALLLETCTEAFFRPSANPVLVTENGHGWLVVTAYLRAPELLYDEFIRACMEHKCFLTLYAHTLQRLALCKSLPDEEKIVDSLLKWVALLKFSETKGAYKAILLWAKALELLLRQMQLGSAHHRLVAGLKVLIGCTSSLGGDRDTKGFFGALGMGTRSSLSTRFRLLSRSLAAMLALQLMDGGYLKAQRTGSAQKPSKQAEKLLQSVAAMLKTREYSDIHEHVAFAHAFLTDPAKTLRDAHGFLAQLCQRLFSDTLYLKVVSDA